VWGGIFVVVIIIFGGTGVGTQGFMFDRQVLYHLSHAFSPFCSGYFGDRVLLFAWTCVDQDPILHFLLSLG
jgi:hypothetical protein